MSGELVGRSISHFRIVRELGAGGMGVVYRAIDEALERPVALKVLPRALAQDADRRRRFLREARAAASVVHANIATVFEVGEADDQIFIAMELVEGETLRARMARPLAVSEARRIARAIVAGLARAHERRVVHRDLKPENVMVAPHGEVKILDFGIAKLFEDEIASEGAAVHAETKPAVTLPGQVLGTPAYMSPEQAHGGAVDARSDVFSFGVMLYEMLAGARPFVGATPVAELVAALTKDPAPLQSLNADVDAELESIVLRCLAKEPNARFADGQALAEALDGTPTGSTSRSDGSTPRDALRSRADAITEVAPVPAAPRPVATGDVALLGSAAPRANRASWRRRLAVVAGLAAIGGAVLVGRARSRNEDPSTAAASTVVPVAGDAGRVGIAITDHPPPKTRKPEAAVAYATALQAYRDASVALADKLMEDALKLEPTLAAGYLRRLLADPGANTEEFAKLSQLRGALDARDLMLFSVVESAMMEPPDFAEVVRRVDAATARFPDDAEIAYVRGTVLAWAGRVEDATAAYDRALELDPHFALVLWAEARLYDVSNDLSRQTPILTRCLAISPSAASCLRKLSLVHEARGECEALLEDGRRMVRIEPLGFRSHEFLGRALAATGAPIESVREALDKMVSHTGDLYNGAPAQLTEDVWLALLAGDLGRADEAAQAIERAVAGRSDEDAHGDVALLRMDLAKERGDVADALRVADDYERRVSAWAPGDPARARLRALYLAHGAGGLADTTFREERDRRYLAEVDRLRQRGGDADAKREAWFAFHGAYAETPDELAELLREVPSHEPVPLRYWRNVGHAYVAARRWDDAIPMLTDVTHRCNILAHTENTAGYAAPIYFMGAHLDLGQALEGKGNTAKACQAYGVILQRWKGAKPRSVTLEKAKERSKALGCGAR